MSESKYSKAYAALNAVIHFEFNRMRRMLEVVDLIPFEINIAIDKVVSEDVAGFEKIAVGI